MKSIVVLASLLVIGVTTSSPISNGTNNRRVIGLFEIDHIVTVGERNFYADSALKTWDQAVQYCSTVGLRKKKLATIISTEEFEALRESYDPLKFKGEYWTVARDALTSGQFVWGDSTQELPSEVEGMPWAVPVITTPTTCAYLYVGSFTETSMRIDLCNKPHKVLCVSV